MEQKVKVDWEKWERQERPKLPWILSMGISASIFSIGLFFGYPALSAGIGCTIMCTTPVLIKMFNHDGHDQKTDQHRSTALF